MGYLQEEIVVPDSFNVMISIMYNRCGKKATTEQIMGWYRDFGQYPEDIMIKACKRIGEEGSGHVITWRMIKDAITAVTPIETNKNGAVGCEYCDCAGLIQYWKEINGQRYQYSARCHKCRTSRYVNEPFYNELFPYDDIQPQCTKESMQRHGGDIKDAVRLITQREHENDAHEQKRKKQLYREQQIEA